MINKLDIPKIVNDLNWKVIMESNSGFYFKNTTERKLKNKLMKDVEFMTTNNLTQLISDFWLIIWKGNKKKGTGELNGKLEVFFISEYSRINFVDNAIVKTLPEDLKNKEFKVLHEMLTKALAVENYELCAVIKSRLLDLIEKDE